MVIEITKKTIIKATIILTVVTFGVGLYCVAYNVGFDNGYEKAVSDNKNKKGDGSNFYAEEKTGARANLLGHNITHDYIMYHSIPDCNAIENGVSKNRAYSDSTYRMNNSVFCPKCMNDYLIELCEAFLQGDFGK